MPRNRGVAFVAGVGFVAIILAADPGRAAAPAMAETGRILAWGDQGDGT